MVIPILAILIIFVIVISIARINYTRKTNCKSLWFGLESGSDEILKSINKNFKAKQAKSILTLASDYIPNLVVSLIVGFPNETFKDFEKTIELANFCQDICSEVYINFLRPQNSTILFNNYSNNMKYIKQNDLIIAPKKLTRKYEQNIINDKDLYAWYYTYETYELKKKMNIIREYKQNNDKKIKSLEISLGEK